MDNMKLIKDKGNNNNNIILPYHVYCRMVEKGLDKQLKEIVDQINKEYDQSLTDIDLRRTNLSTINKHIEIIIQTSSTIMDQLNGTIIDSHIKTIDNTDVSSTMESPIYFDPEEDELIACKSYCTKSFYAIDK